ncbi:dnaJ (Hsp40) homolog, subfamily C, member 30b [Nematolebias whitei]|uniref:dnaJ (Hsp40) homolog, subfamily C, member 30b n=1 Tax=Nematolebias whitei TaxID=451745 RepID=UPI00189A98A2|nr:dnaJ (Hsp40) homolog, subfamily C, member 30b [Nematolebias whitei]
MAAVSRRFIDYGIYRLVGFRTTPNRPLCIEGSPGSLLNCASCRSPTKEENVQVLSQNRAGLVSEKLHRLKEAQNQQKHVTFLGAASFHLPSSRLICCTDTIERPQASTTGLPISTGFLENKLPSSSRSKGFVFNHSETLRSVQQLRAFCTALFILKSTWSEKLSSELRLPHTLRGSTTTRGYSKRSKTTYYDVLKVSPSATQSQIKTAYYKQSLIYHPDKNAGSQEATQRFSDISEAYTVLGNISKRKKYDQGIPSQFDTGRQSTKETTSRFTGYQRQHKARHFYQTDGRPIYDFDAYYQAHYGEQLRRARAIRARKKQLEEMQEKNHEEVMVATILLAVSMAGLIFFSYTKF